MRTKNKLNEKVWVVEENNSFIHSIHKTEINALRKLNDLSGIVKFNEDGTTNNYYVRQYDLEE